MNRLSIAALPPFRRRTAHDLDAQQIARDVFVTIWFLLAILSVSTAHRFAGSPWVLRAFASVALYRALDLFMTLIRAGIFLSFRGDVQLNEEPRWRIRRTLLAMFINYVELILWYGVVYFYVAKAGSLAFVASPDSISKALQMSVATMTMVGYGSYAPDGLWTTLLTFSQIATALILVVLVVGALLSLLTADEKDRPAVASSPATNYWCPLLSTIIVLTVLFNVLPILATTS